MKVLKGFDVWESESISDGAKWHKLNGHDKKTAWRFAKTYIKFMSKESKIDARQSREQAR